MDMGNGDAGGPVIPGGGDADGDAGGPVDPSCNEIAQPGVCG